MKLSEAIKKYGDVEWRIPLIDMPEPEWSHSKLTLAIAELAYPDDNVIRVDTGSKYEVIVEPSNKTCLSCGVGESFTVNYFDWRDLMPLVIEHEISLVFNFSDGKWDAIGDVDTTNKDPQRALCECVYQVLLVAKSKEQEDG